MRYTNLFQRLLANSVESDVYGYQGTCCWEWTGPKQRRGGYGRVSVHVPGKGTQGKLVHRVVAALVLGRQLDPDLETVEHACELTWCFNPLHLEIASRAANTADMQNRRRKKQRLVFKPLVDPDLYSVDRFIRSLPTLRRTPSEIEPCPF